MTVVVVDGVGEREGYSRVEGLYRGHESQPMHTNRAAT